jgi:CRISPR-associated protein Cas1
MLRQVVEITGHGKRLNVDRGFLTVSADTGVIGSIPIDDIEAVIAESAAVTYSGVAIDELARRGTPLVICGQNYVPSVWMVPVDGHHAQGTRMRSQAEASRPLSKRLWSTIVHQKLRAQAEALERQGENSLPLLQMAKQLRSGDPGNIEARAAQYYFPKLFGPAFKRDRNLPGINAMLNYGYTVVRAATARSIISSGLNPSLGVFHKSRGDALALADDLMEPFRPAVDIVLASERAAELNKYTKSALVALLHKDFRVVEGVSPLTICLVNLASSLTISFLSGKAALRFPISCLPDESEKTDT